ncbi:MAG: arsenite methyltransferase [Candidatus Zixiibacteriota bacterium]|nr:MAG: arsenite methyltransferase [candidate division Zixibacteria bacterium]
MTIQKAKEKRIKNFVKNRYGNIAKKRETSCSCNGVTAMGQAEAIGYSTEELKEIPESALMGLGCGNPAGLASLKAGETVLDLGSGGGVDVFLAANKVGETGWVIGVDMTPEMIRRAKVSARKAGYKNVEFRVGEIENLPIEDESVDVIISNCVINLSPDKERVFAEGYRALRPGGRMVVSDIVTDKELPDDIRKSFSAWAECIGGALVRKEYLSAIKKAGFSRIRVLDEKVFLEEGMSDKIKGRIISIKVEAKKGRTRRT